MSIRIAGLEFLFREEQVTGRFSMNNLMKMEDREIRQGKISGDHEKVDDFKKKISDEKYLDHAISKLATDLSHYLTK